MHLISLPNSLKNKKDEIESYFTKANKRILEFAKLYDWSHFLKNGYIDEAIIFDDKTIFHNQVKEILNLDESITFPDALSAVLEKRIFIALSPSLYDEIFPEGIEENSYEKLITHEIAHRLHVDIVDGNEDAMGPIWFFEGFAIYAASQFENNMPALKENEIWSIIENPDRGSYLKYSSVMHYLLTSKSIPLKDLIYKASNKNFLVWLKTSCNKKGE